MKANFDRVPQLGARSSLPKGYLSGYAGSTVVSPTQLTVSFDRPNVQFLQGTSTHSLGILSPASVALSDDERCTKVIGSGPFTLKSYTKNSATVLAKRPGYTSPSSLATHQGDAYLDELEFRVVPESGVRVGSLQSGEVDAIGNIGQQDEAPLAGGGDPAAGPRQPGAAVRDHLQRAAAVRRRSGRAPGAVLGDRPSRGRRRRLHVADEARDLPGGLQHPVLRRRVGPARLRRGEGRRRCSTAPAGRPAPTGSAPRPASRCASS